MAHALENAAKNARNSEEFVELAIEIIRGLEKWELEHELAEKYATNLDAYYIKVREAQNV